MEPPMSHPTVQGAPRTMASSHGEEQGTLTATLSLAGGSGTGHWKITGPRRSSRAARVRRRTRRHSRYCHCGRCGPASCGDRGELTTVNVLAEIIEGVRLVLAERQERVSLDDLKAKV